MASSAFSRMRASERNAMSAVIEFPASRIAKVAKDEDGAPAQVIIFPGVRIERPEISLADRITPSKPRSAR
jgi:hypothetical protein